MYLLFIIQFVGGLWAKAERAATPPRAQRPVRRTRRPQSALPLDAFLPCVGQFNVHRAGREGPPFYWGAQNGLSACLGAQSGLSACRRVQSGLWGAGVRSDSWGANPSGAEALLAWVRLAAFWRLPIGGVLRPCLVSHRRAESRAVVRSRSSSPTTFPSRIGSSGIGWTHWA
jgi:hypothetical protein